MFRLASSSEDTTIIFWVKKLFYLNIMWHVYILKCSDGTYYTGCTNNLENRLERHSKGKVHYTKDKLPIELITYIAFIRKVQSLQF